METALFCSLGASPSGARRAGGKAKLLRHLELEVMALGAVVLALLVPHVAVRAVKIRAVVRGVMRVRRFHVFRRRDELILRVAGGAGRGGGHRVLRLMARHALHAVRRVEIRHAFRGGGAGREGEAHREGGC